MILTATDEYFIVMFTEVLKMVLHLSSWKGYRETILISFGFPFYRLSLSSKCTFGDCDVCYLFYKKNLASPYKCSKVELIYSACVKRKTLKPSNGYHMDGTGSSETNIYSSGTLVTVDDVRPIYPPQTFDIN